MSSDKTDPAYYSEECHDCGAYGVELESIDGDLLCEDCADAA